MEEATKALNNLQQHLTSIGMKISISETKVMIINKKDSLSTVNMDKKEV